MKHLELLILLTSLAYIGYSQQDKIAFEKYNVAEGLPEEYVTGLIQDDKGFIWAATQNGLVKYDGYQFKVYKVSSDSSQHTRLRIRSLSGGLYKAKDGKIWIGGDSSCGGTIASFNPVSEQFKNYFLPEIIYGNKRGTSYIIHEDANKNIWFRNENPANPSINYVGRLYPIDGSITIYPDSLMLGSSLLPVNINIVLLDSSVFILDSQNNLKKWNPATDTFELVLAGGKSPVSNLKPDTIHWISEARHNCLFLNGRQTIYIYDAQKKKITESHSKGIDSGIIMAATEDATGIYWLMHKGGNITCIHPKTRHYQMFKYGEGQLAFPGAPESLSDAFVVCHQNKKGIWFQSFESESGSSFFLYYDFLTKNFNFYNNNFNSPENKMLSGRSRRYNFMEDRSGLLWLYTRPGMYRQSKKKNQMELYRHHADSPESLPSDTINCLFEDSKKRLWIGTIKGLALYNPDKNNFRTFRHDPVNAATISNNSINSIVEDADGNIWIGTANGLNQWQETGEIFRRFFYNITELNNCLTLFSDKQQRIWLSVRNKGIFVLDRRTGEILQYFKPEKNNPLAITATEINIIYQDSRENIWLGTYNRTNTMAGLFRLNQAEDGFFHYQPKPGDNSCISHRVIFFFTEDKYKRLWIGTNGGLNLYDPEKDCFRVYYNNTITALSAFCFDIKGELWFGTYSGGGLVNIDLEKEFINAYDETTGLLHNDLSILYNRRIAVDNFGKFWLPTQRGLSVFDPDSKLFVSYFEKDGFQPYARSYVTIKTSDGDIWIGSRNGLNRIVPANLLVKDTTLPAVVITKVITNDSEFLIPDGNIFKKSVAYTDDFQLKHWQKDISFDFVALHYLRPEDNQYSWKLENYDKEWTVPSKERKTSYTNLAPGNYVFKVKASNADGVWNEEGASIALTILPPWWQTWWAYLIYVLLILAALRSYSIWRERHLRKEKEHLQAKVEERTSELKKSLEEIKSTQTQLIHSEKMASLGVLTAGIAHEIQNPLNFVNNFSEVNTELIDEALDENDKGNLPEVKSILNDLKENEYKISHHGKRAEAIVKGMLLHSRGSSGIKEPTDMNAMADEYIRLSYHGMRAKDKNFNAEYNTDFDTNLPKINVVPQDIGRVLLNLMNNAFYAVNGFVETLHATSLQTPLPYKPTVMVSTKHLGDRIGISVKDNGPGIPEEIKDKIFQPFFTTKPTGQGTGLGLSMAYDIVKAHGGDIRVKSNDREGSEFIIHLPVT
jgi:signal transduction histidine kinase/ligand-binding sensor domain-containing protein